MIWAYECLTMAWRYTTHSWWNTKAWHRRPPWLGKGQWSFREHSLGSIQKRKQEPPPICLRFRFQIQFDQHICSSSRGFPQLLWPISITRMWAIYGWLSQSETLTAPTENIIVKTMRVHLLPIQFDKGALPRAPKKAPACKTDTTLDDKSFTFLAFLEPLGFNIPKFFWKYGCVTIPPAIPLWRWSVLLDWM